MFLVVEGVDGSGKSTVVKALVSELEAQGRPFLSLREPGSTNLGEGLRQILLHQDGALNPWAEAALFTAARAQLVEEVIRPALVRGQVVLLDRYFYSTVAYQGFGSELDPAELLQLSHSAVDGLLPDGVLLLDLPWEAASPRLDGRDRLESRGAEYFGRVRDGYLRLAEAEPERFTVLDAARDEAVVRADALAWARMRWAADS